MRLSYVICLFVVAGYTSATVSPILGAVSGITALGSSLASLAGMIPAGLLLPLLILKVPLKLGLLMKLKLLKSPIAGPMLATKGAVLLATKSHAKSISHIATGIFEFPLKAKAMTIGAVHGAWAGGKAALASYKTLPKPSIFHASVIPASVLLDEPEQVLVPLPEPEGLSYGRRPVAPAYAPPVADPEPDVPSYANKSPAPAYTPAPPAYTPAPPAYTPAAPAYTPAPPAYTPAPPAYTPAPPAYTPAPPTYSHPAPAPEVQYRKRREVEGAEVESNEEIIGETFTFMQEVDKDFCVPKTLCEIAVEPIVARGYGDDILNFLEALRDDPQAPWMPFKLAVMHGKASGSRESCAMIYSSCRKATETLIGEALSQLES